VARGHDEENEMSAYIVDETDIAAIAKIAAHKVGWRSIGGRIVNMVKREINEFDAPEIAKILAVQNITSVEYRYPNHGEAGGMLVGPTCDYVAACMQMARNRDVPVNADNIPLVYRPADLYELVARYEYQSCEDPEWIQSDAYWICHRVKDYAAQLMIQELAPEEEAA